MRSIACDEKSIHNEAGIVLKHNKKKSKYKQKINSPVSASLYIFPLRSTPTTLHMRQIALLFTSPIKKILL